MSQPYDQQGFQRMASRRSALRGMVRLGGGLLLAGGAAGAQRAFGARLPLPAGPPLSSATPAAAAAPPPGPGVAAAPAPPDELRLNILPSTLAIPAVDLHAAVESARSVRNAQGRPEIVVPEHGVASPNATLGRNAINNVWILGHSRWQGVPQIMHRLGAIRRGDLITITGFERTRRQELPALDFHAEHLLVTDTESATAEIYQARPRFPRLILQTSVRQTGDRGWILERRALEAHAEFRMRGDPDDPSKYLLLLVIGGLTPSALTRLLLPPQDVTT